MTWKDTVAPILYMLITMSMYWSINKIAKEYTNVSEAVDGIYKDSTNKEDFINHTYALLLTSSNLQSTDKIKGILSSLYDKRKELEDQIVPTWSAKIGKKSWDVALNQVVSKRLRGFRADQDFRQNVESIKDDFLRNSIVEITKKFEKATGLREFPALASSHYR